MSRHESQGRVKADVVHRARHRLETDHLGTRLFQPIDTRRYDHFSDSLPLVIRMDGEWTHPPLDTRAMHHVEGGDSVAGVAPDHRAFFGVGDREFPHCRVEMRHPYADHAILAVSFRTSLAEDGVERWDFAHAYPVRRLRHPGMSPVARECHYAPAPAPLSTDSSVTRSRARASRSKKLRWRSTRSTVSESPTMELPVSAS